MWKEERTGFGNDPGGDVEMVPTSDGYDDEDDGIGFTMGNPGQVKTSRGRNKGAAKFYCCLLLLLLTVVGLVLTYVYGPDFGLLTGGESDTDANNQQHQEVLPQSIVDNDAYDIMLQVPVPHVEGDLVLYQHKKTKTPVMTILPYDTIQDSVFAISFRTKPSNSRGAPHVLEHSVLAGSKKYPIKDPFTQLLKGSQTTFVNAMTFDDLTAYICASRNNADMKNLMSVYMDAVFQPLVIEEEGKWIFRQEGWRVESNETGEPEFNGVVLSEMKGALSDPDEILDEYATAQMFPNTTYRFNSGGDPKVIPELNHRELQEFYKTFYHPSNAQVFLYGTKASAENCLINLDEYLTTYEPRTDIREQSKIELQPLLGIEPKKQSIPYASDDEEAKHQVSMSWMISGDGNMDDDFQKENRVAYTVLQELLMNEKIGVLYRTLQDSGLGGSLDGGIEKGLQQWTFDLTVHDVNGTDVEKVEDLVHSTLQQIVDKGFDKRDIAAAMNSVEFNNRDISSYTYPRGINLWMQVMDTWKFDLDPLSGFLSFEDNFKALQQRLGKHGSDIFVKIVKQNLIENEHSIVIDMYPDTKLAQKNAEEEQARLVKLRQSQSFPGLLDEADDLSDKQVTEDPPELLATIPSVAVSDLDKHGYEPPILIDEDRDGSGVTVLVHEVESSFGIVYVDLGVDISMLDFEDIVLVPLLARLMVDAGTEKYSDVEIAREVGTNTGGIDEDFVITPILPVNATAHYRVPNGNHFYSHLFLRGAASTEKDLNLLELLSQIMFHARLDSQERALGVLRQKISDMERSLASGGTHYAMSRINARYSAVKFVTEEYRGVASLPKLREILKTAESDWSSVLERLQKMMDAILKGNRNGMILNISGEKAVLKHIAPRVTPFLTHQLPDRSNESPLPNFVLEPHPWATEAKKLISAKSPMTNEGVVSSGTVNFVGAGAPFYEPFDEMPGSTEVVTQFVEFNNFMLQIRERRGAYGAFAMTEKFTGILMFMTYRDPNLLETLEVFRAVPSYLKEQMADPDRSAALIESAIIGTIGTLDGSAPQPNTAGWISMVNWLHGSTPKLRQAWREEILATSSQDFLDYANRFEGWKPTLGVSGPKATLAKEKGLNLTMIDLL